MKISIIFLGLLIAGQELSAQSDEVMTHIRNGNNYYKKEQYDPAANEYSKALQLDPGNTTARFNLANTMYKLNRQDVAIKSYKEIAAAAGETGLKSNAHYNHGVVETKQKKLEESIESYKNALRQNPDHKEARENLQKALLELKKKNQQNQQNKNQKQNKQDQSKMNQKESEQKLKLLEQKEKETQERINKEKSKTGGGTGKDW